MEADVWLRNNDLLIGHSASSLTASRSLISLYIDALVSSLSYQNQPRPDASLNAHGIFEIDPNVSLTLLVDIKTDGPSALPFVSDQLEPLRSRGFLSHSNGSAFVPGPVTVVGTGNMPFDHFLSNRSHRDIFFDAPLADLWGEDAPSTRTQFNTSTSYYASASFAAAIGKPWHGILTPQQVEVIRGQVRAASAKGLKARYWDTPSWPIGLRNHIWDVLVKEGVGMLNVDDLVSASERQWVA